VDTALVNGISQAAHGRAEFVVNNMDIESRVMKLFKEALAPSITKLSVSWGLEVQQSPYGIPAIRNGSRMIVYGLVKQGESPEKIEVTGVDPENTPLKWVIPVTVRKGNTIQKMAAYSLIRDLQEGYSEYHSNTQLPSPDTIKQEIIKLGIKYQLASNHTSFVTTVEGEEATSGEIKLQNIILAKPPEPEITHQRKAMVGRGGGRSTTYTIPASSISAPYGTKAAAPARATAAGPVRGLSAMAPRPNSRAIGSSLEVMGGLKKRKKIKKGKVRRYLCNLVM